MKAFILAAGLGTRLKPWTNKHPKALVPVGGVPMLARVIDRLREECFDDIIINVHHFADQIIDFLNNNDFNVKIRISDESMELLDTGGGLLKVLNNYCDETEPVLVHNVDILSNAPLRLIMEKHLNCGNDISLVTSQRRSTRKLIFNNNSELIGWHNLVTDEYKPSSFRPLLSATEASFSGIYVVNALVKKQMELFSDERGTKEFPIMDFLLNNVSAHNHTVSRLKIRETVLDELELIDIGKPDTLHRANVLFGQR